MLIFRANQAKRMLAKKKSSNNQKEKSTTFKKPSFKGKGAKRR